MQLSRLTLSALLALGLWFALDFIGVPRLVDKEPVASLAGLMLSLLIVFFVVGALKVRYAALIYSFSLFVWLWLQVDTHWATYLLPASPQKLAWYERVFGDHVRVLPVIPTRTTPDAFHTLLAVLILINLFLAIRDVLRRAPGSCATA